ncbi:MAG: DUF5941 domain-containing protein [Solirubrobacteraceae bacterium]
MSATTALKASAPTERASVLEFYRDDGPIAAAIGALTGGRLRGPAIAFLFVAALPAFLAIVVNGDGASHGLLAGAIAWAVLLGGLASGRPLDDRLRWMVPSALRVIEYAGLLWVASVAGASSLPAVFALLCAITYHHYDVVYGLRHRGIPLPRAVQAAGGGWDGRLLLGLVLLLAGALPGGLYVMAVAVAALFIGATVSQWRHIGRGARPVYDDEEDEDD